MTRGTKPGRRRADVGKPRPRHKPERSGDPIPDDPVRRALSGEVDADEWAELRVPTWKKWLELVTSEPDDEWRELRARYWENPRSWTPETDYLFREPERDPARDYAPRAARLDGITGVALSRWHQGSPSDLERQTEWAEEGLAELARFRTRSPEAAKSIAAPLREYAKRLREVRDHPESRTYDYDRLYGSGASAPL
jgi:hypothetical protein